MGLGGEAFCSLIAWYLAMDSSRFPRCCLKGRPACHFRPIGASRRREIQHIAGRIVGSTRPNSELATQQVFTKPRPVVPVPVQIYRSGNKPGIQSLASLAGKLSRKGARWVSDFSAPTASSSAVTFRV